MPVGQPFSFWIVGVVPEAVAVFIVAAPVGAADVVVEDDHDVGLGEGFYDRVHHLHRVLAFELRVRFDGVVGDDGVVLEGFVGPGKADGVDADLLDLVDDGG